eukprot:jgi/Chlat1/618/Chrsp103S01039
MVETLVASPGLPGLAPYGPISAAGPFAGRREEVGDLGGVMGMVLEGALRSPLPPQEEAAPAVDHDGDVLRSAADGGADGQDAAACASPVAAAIESTQAALLADISCALDSSFQDVGGSDSWQLCINAAMRPIQQALHERLAALQQYLQAQLQHAAAQFTNQLDEAQGAADQTTSTSETNEEKARFGYENDAALASFFYIEPSSARMKYASRSLDALDSYLGTPSKRPPYLGPGGTSPPTPPIHLPLSCPAPGPSLLQRSVAVAPQDASQHTFCDACTQVGLEDFIDASAVTLSGQHTPLELPDLDSAERSGLVDSPAAMIDDTQDTSPMSQARPHLSSANSSSIGPEPSHDIAERNGQSLPNGAEAPCTTCGRLQEREPIRFSSIDQDNGSLVHALSEENDDLRRTLAVISRVFENVRLPVLFKLAMSSDKNLAVLALRTLASLAYSEEHQELIVNGGGTKLFLRYLAKPDSTAAMRQVVAAAIEHLCLHPACQVRLVRGSGLYKLIAVCSSLKDDTTLYHLLGAVCTLAANGKVHSAIARSGGLALLARKATANSLDIRCQVAKALANVVLFRVEADSLLVDEVMVSLLVDMAHDHPDIRVQRSVARSLQSLLEERGDNEYAECLARNGGMQLLETMLTSSDEVVRWLARACEVALKDRRGSRSRRQRG